MISDLLDEFLGVSTAIFRLWRKFYPVGKVQPCLCRMLEEKPVNYIKIAGNYDA